MFLVIKNFLKVKKKFKTLSIDGTVSTITTKKYQKLKTFNYILLYFTQAITTFLFYAIYYHISTRVPFAINKINDL